MGFLIKKPYDRSITLLTELNLLSQAYLLISINSLFSESGCVVVTVLIDFLQHILKEMKGAVPCEKGP